MKLSKIVTGAALAAVLGAGVAPAFAGEMSNMPPAAIQATVVPTPGQAQDQLTQVGRHLIEAERRSFYSPDADTNFRAAQIALQNGRYDQEVADLSRVQTQLKSAPYWDALTVAPGNRKRSSSAQHSSMPEAQATSGYL